MAAIYASSDGSAGIILNSGKGPFFVRNRYADLIAWWREEFDLPPPNEALTRLPRDPSPWE